MFCREIRRKYCLLTVYEYFVITPSVSSFIRVVITPHLFRDQNNKTKYNLVSETLILLGNYKIHIYEYFILCNNNQFRPFVDCICGSTTGGLGLLGKLFAALDAGNVGIFQFSVS
jgi:hypothetical protein